MVDDARIEQRVAERARHLWQAAGRPPGGPDEYRDEAREIVAIEDSNRTTLEPIEQSDIEPAEIMQNLGEFPTLVDQGEEQTVPVADPRQQQKS